MADVQKLESVVRELTEMYNITAPPIPIEQMLQDPYPDMWSEVDMNEFSSTILNVSTPFAPRMSLARFLARHLIRSAWGAKRDLAELDDDDEMLYRFARMIAMPLDLVLEISAESRTPPLIGLHFEVPEDDARLRLNELSAYAR